MEDFEFPLSATTARLSISNQDRPQVNELMNNITEQRRDSAVSFDSLGNENDDLTVRSNDGAVYDKLPSPLQQVGDTLKKKGRRRRRSSALSKDTTIQPKVHKRKLKKMLESPSIEFQTTLSNFSIYDFTEIPMQIFSELPGNLKPKFKILGAEHIPKLVFCFVGGLTREMFIDTTTGSLNYPSDINLEAGDHFPFITTNFQKAITFKSPGDKRSLFSPIDALTHYRLNKKEKRKLLTDLQSKKITIEDLKLLLYELKSNNYPIHSSLENQPCTDGWVETKSFEHEGSHIFALDCEFCSSGEEKVLTRISVVDFNGEIKFDTFVKPSVPITDYLTKYSGITEESLLGVTTTLEDVQNKILELVSADDYLVGHSLESDLNVMKVRHPKIVDTSICFHHIRGPPSKPGLRWLSTKHLARNIQLGEQSGEGHSSVEDAKASLDLVKLKIMEGSLFGMNYLEVFIIDKINEARKLQGLDEISGMLIDYQCEDKETNNYRSICVNNDDEVVDNFTREIDDKDIAILHLRELEAAKGWSSTCTRDSDVENSYKNLNNRLNTIHSLLPKNSMFIILSIYGGDITKVNQLRKLRRDATEDNILDLTTRLCNEIETVRESIGFISTKD